MNLVWISIVIPVRVVVEIVFVLKRQSSIEFYLVVNLVNKAFNQVISTGINGDSKNMLLLHKI